MIELGATKQDISFMLERNHPTFVDEFADIKTSLTQSRETPYTISKTASVDEALERVIAYIEALLQNKVSKSG